MAANTAKFYIEQTHKVGRKTFVHPSAGDDPLVVVNGPIRDALGRLGLAGTVAETDQILIPLSVMVAALMPTLRPTAQLLTELTMGCFPKLDLLVRGFAAFSDAGIFVSPNPDSDATGATGLAAWLDRLRLFYGENPAAFLPWDIGDGWLSVEPSQQLQEEEEPTANWSMVAEILFST